VLAASAIVVVEYAVETRCRLGVLLNQYLPLLITEQLAGGSIVATWP
jgi:hypothetical protein|tara:strand:+ start:800 stop:940 length:141 start_codon:yes stop_codon:yes gene_type:complete